MLLIIFSVKSLCCSVIFIYTKVNALNLIEIFTGNRRISVRDVKLS